MLKVSNLVVTQVESEPNLGFLASRRNSFDEIVIRIESTFTEEIGSLDDSPDVEEGLEDDNGTTCSSSDDST